MVLGGSISAVGQDRPERAGLGTAGRQLDCQGRKVELEEARLVVAEEPVGFLEPPKEWLIVRQGMRRAQT